MRIILIIIQRMSNCMRKSIYYWAVVCTLFLFQSFSYAESIKNTEIIELVTPYGTTLLSAPPQRVLALEYSFIDSLLELGVTPIAIAEGEVGEGFLPPYLEKPLAGLPNVGTRHQPSLEKILALQPDVIIIDPLFNANIRPQLEKIAPTVMLDGITATPEQQMEAIQLFGTMLQKESQADILIDKFTTRYTQLKENNQGTQKTVLVGYISEAGLFRSLTANAPATDILQDFGYTNVVTTVNERQSTPLTLEAIFAQNPEIIIILLTDGDEQGYEAFQKQPLWQQLTAIKNEKVFFFDRDIWAKSHGIIAMQQKLDDLVNSNLAQEEVYEKN